MSKIGYAILISVLAVVFAMWIGCSKEPAAPTVVVEEEVVEEVEVPALDATAEPKKSRFQRARVERRDRGAGQSQRSRPHGGARTENLPRFGRSARLDGHADQSHGGRPRCFHLLRKLPRPARGRSGQVPGQARRGQAAIGSTS